MIAGRSVRAQLLIGGATPGQVVLVYIRKEAEKAMPSRLSVNSILPWLASVPASKILS